MPFSPRVRPGPSPGESPFFRGRRGGRFPFFIMRDPPGLEAKCLELRRDDLRKGAPVNEAAHVLEAGGKEAPLVFHHRLARRELQPLTHGDVVGRHPVGVAPVSVVDPLHGARDLHDKPFLGRALAAKRPDKLFPSPRYPLPSLPKISLPLYARCVYQSAGR